MYKNCDYVAYRSRIIESAFKRAKVSDALEAYEAGKQMHIKLVRGFPQNFEEAVNGLVSIVKSYIEIPPLQLRDFPPEEIVNNQAFEKFRDDLNKEGLDIETFHDAYLLISDDESHARGVNTSHVRFGMIPWDGTKKALKAFDRTSVPRPKSASLGGLGSHI